jgi:uncharacterized protein (DUF2141 family)
MVLLNDRTRMSMSRPASIRSKDATARARGSTARRAAVADARRDSYSDFHRRRAAFAEPTPNTTQDLSSMNPIRLSPLVHVACIAAMAVASAAAQAHDLTVEVLGARSDKGSVDGALYADAGSWMKHSLQGERAPAGAKTVLVYRNLQPGSYAVSVFHDENGNGKLDSNIAGIPTERYGFSRDAHGRMAAPSFADAAIDLRGDTTITIHLR